MVGKGDWYTLLQHGNSGNLGSPFCLCWLGRDGAMFFPIVFPAVECLLCKSFYLARWLLSWFFC